MKIRNFIGSFNINANGRSYGALPIHLYKITQHILADINCHSDDCDHRSLGEGDGSEEEPASI